MLFKFYTEPLHLKLEHFWNYLTPLKSGDPVAPLKSGQPVGITSPPEVRTPTYLELLHPLKSGHPVGIITPLEIRTPCWNYLSPLEIRMP